jgi:hypothetical protein
VNLTPKQAADFYRVTDLADDPCTPDACCEAGQPCDHHAPLHDPDAEVMARIDRVVAMVRAELVSATLKFGPFASAHEGYAVILEEVDELWDEVKNGKRPGARLRQENEARQVAAMGARFLLDAEGWPDTEDPHWGSVMDGGPR